ncbi:MAG: hypothetical protein M0036_14010 [Desulfobacteraceae bacterium]|nr:hypothetical protein [Desulfobacteraceae bacterium]
MVHTNNRGGQTITKRFRVFTNDPQTPETELMVTGQILAVVEVSPDRVKLVGNVGDTLTQQVHITPVNGQAFTIKEIKANRGLDNIRWELKPQSKEKPPKKGYVLTIICGSKTEGRMGDQLLLETDMNDKPTLRIPISCNVFAKTTRSETQPVQ